MAARNVRVRPSFAAFCAAGLAALALPSLAQGVEPPRSFEYLYIEANSGASSGGHVAVRFGDATFHYQQLGGGTIRIVKDDSDGFEHEYRALGNRAIHASRVVVDGDTYTALRRAFDLQFLIQSHQFDVLAALARDRRFLEALIRRDRSATRALGPIDLDGGRMGVPGAGYFFTDEAVPEEEGTPAGPGVRERLDPETARTAAAPIRSLARRVRELKGENFLERRVREIEDEIRALSPTLGNPPAPRLAEGVLLAEPAGFFQRYCELASGWLALAVLRSTPPLAAGAAVAPEGVEFDLDEAEIGTLRAISSRWEEALPRLLDSTRPDWGYPLLVGMARLAALDASVRSGRLVLLDVFAQAPPLLTADSVERNAEALTQILEERREEFLAARAEFFGSGGVREEDLGRVEIVGNLFAELRRGVTLGGPIRVHTGTLVPEKAALRSDWPLPSVPDEDLAHGIAATRAREEAYEVELRRLYPYNVVTRNCVTELFRTIDLALARDPADTDAPEAAAGRARPERSDDRASALLGGMIETERTLNFIPVVSAMSVDSTYRVLERIDLPSYRTLRLERMYAAENQAAVYLRESNTLTSKIYARNPSDPFFVFFTDDAVAPRPVYGAANLAAGLGQSFLGAVIAPFDKGKTLAVGLNGALFSLPELFFVNIRKGSFEIVPHEWTSGDRRPAARLERRARIESTGR